MANLSSIISIASDIGPLAVQLGLAAGTAFAGVLVAKRFFPRKPADATLGARDRHLLDRLQKLLSIGDMARFSQTCAWIKETHGPDVLTWMRERAEAEGRTALAARLADI